MREIFVLAFWFTLIACLMMGPVEFARTAGNAIYEFNQAIMGVK